MSKKAKILISVFSIFMTALMCVAVILSVFTFKSVNDTAKMVKSVTGTVEDTGDEDGVLIANQYMIKSTTQISDAYKSGDASKLDDKDKETLELASAVLDKIIKPDMTDYEKERAVYVYLTTKLKSTNGILTVITTSTENYEPHDVLKNKSAVCVGYATTFRMFMQMLNIDCKVVHSSDLTHSWDLVKLDDGWYHVDCYSDDNTASSTTVTEYDNELGVTKTKEVSDSNAVQNDNATYANFNMDDTYCGANHNWSREYYPAAEGKKYNYILNNKKTLKNIYALPDYTAKMISKNKSMIVCSFKKFDEKAQRAANYMVDCIQTNFSNDNRSVSYQWTLDADGQYVLIINVSYYGTSANEIDDATSEKINDKVFEAIDKYEINN